jgi:5-methylcytosine-specific restriction endonuclease McrA
VEPLAPARYSVRFTATAELHDKLERLQALMRHSVPDGDLAAIIDAAVTRELERLEARRFARTKNPRQRLGRVDTTPKTRHIPAAVRRAVHERDGSRCTYRDKSGRRCPKRHDLEYHHRKPFGHGGDHSPENLALACRPHNALLAEQDFGEEVMARHRRRASHDRGTGPAGVAGAERVDTAVAGAGPVDTGVAGAGPVDRTGVGAGPGPSGLRARSP